MLDFRRIEFGQADAKEEGQNFPRLLMQGYFDASGIVEKALGKATFIFLGYKGSGKTALGEHIKLMHNNATTRVEIELLDSFPFKRLAKIESGDSDLSAKLCTAWNWVLLVSAFAMIDGVEDVQVEDREGWMRTKAELSKMGLMAASRFSDIVKQSSKNTFKGNLKVFEFAHEVLCGADAISLDGLISYMKHLLSSVHTDTRQYLIIDGLDEILSENGLQLQAIAALITQSKLLNSFYSEKNLPFKIIILCRTDIFERLELPNLNKIKQDSAYKISWFDESIADDYSNNELMQLVNRRASLQYPDGGDIFETFFPKEYNGKEIRQALLDYTRHTPRDLLQLLKRIQGYCTTEKVSEKAIRKGIKAYCSDYFLSEIKDEMVGYASPTEKEMIIQFLQSPFIVRNKWSDKEIRDFKDANQEFKNADFYKIFKVLFDCSALGLVEEADKPETPEANDKNFFKYRNPNRIFPKGMKMRLHSALWEAIRWG